MSDLQYKCPSCSAPIEFDPSSGQMACAYCNSRYEVAEVERFNATANAESATNAAAAATAGLPQSEASYLDPSDIANMRPLVCNSCGAEIIADEKMISTRCGFCGNTFVASDRIRNTRIPDLIIPFAIDKKGMLEAFIKATKGKFLLPKTFRDTHKLAEATGAYIPYWFHDGTTSGTITYKATNTRHWSDSDYDYTETDVYEVQKDIAIDYTGVPACASTVLEPGRSEGAEPFNVGESKAFATAYLSGYAATSYDIEPAETVERVDQRVKNSVSSIVASTVTGFQTVAEKSQNLIVEHKAIWYALLPVWLIVISYNGQNYPFAINGQTGEVVGSFPISKGKLRGLQAAFIIGFFALFALLGYFLLGFVRI